MILIMAIVSFLIKSLKPKSGVFCYLIHEARATTALEMPECENTFVIKVGPVCCCIFF